MSEDIRKIEFTLREKSEFFNSFYSLYASQMPVGDIFKSMSSTYKNGRIHDVCLSISYRIDRGSTLKEAVFPFRNVLGSAYSAILAAGEASGRLEEAAADICRNIEKQQEIRSGLINALIYPASILVFALGAAMLLQFFIIPSFKSVSDYESNINTSALLITACIKIAAVYGILAALAAAALKIPEIKRKIKKILSKFPVIKGILKNYYFADFFYIMSAAYDAGIPAAECVMLSASVIGSEETKDKLNNAAKMIENGKTVSSAFAAAGVFSSYALSQTAAGEESGRLDKTLKTAAKDYERSMDEAVKILLKLLGPAVILIAGIITAVLLGKMYTEYYNALFSMF